MSQVILFIALPLMVALFIVIDIARAIEVVRLRRSRKRYLEMIEVMKAEQSAKIGADFDRRAFRKTLGGWDQ